jgi:sterol desaturase/sphingolipid hydroxylase (fatty acid hydroxylase superfamily)
VARWGLRAGLPPRLLHASKLAHWLHAVFAMFRATPDSPRMFQRDIVDAFSRTHFMIVPILYVPAVALLVAYSLSRQALSGAATLLWVSAGALAWSLAEYVTHRYLFHLKARSAFGTRLHFIVHGVHHEWPNDRYRLVMPPAVSIFLFCACLWLFTSTLGRAGYAFHAGFTLGYLHYDLMHYYLHHGKPRNGYLRRLRKHHMVHHFKAPGTRFGVSSRLWDYVFRTRA